MSDNNNFQELIKNLKSLNDDKVVSHVLPESKIKVSLKPLQAKHISKINSSLLASASQSVKKTMFNKLVEQILNEILVLPEETSYSDFTIFDYYFLLFTLRESINPVLTVSDDGTEVTVDIKEKLKEYTSTKFKTKLNKIGGKTCEVYLRTPSYKLMRRFEDITNERQISEEKKGEKNYDMEGLVRDMFSFSIIPYIEKIKTLVDGNEEEIPFVDLSTSQKVGILDLIPSELYKKLIDGIGKLNEPIDKLLSTENDDIKIPLDQTFLIDSE